ncbi:hypothetical protein [Flavobacterium frigidarium]|uniref:hypothetical protein n=1 Tax=Flavobacterium frigidarium TaxID=99286 RepID=UPI0003FF33AD|nr:hypothetical protein [Flavobacterium frigidarium]|tara:strand:+ start:2304 stop:2597 length:294 start_codon:yes stop_codon:yes gene_type:complete
MAVNHSWSIEDCLLVISEFVKRYKTEDYKKIEKDVAKKIGTTTSSVILTRQNYIALLEGKSEGFGANASKAQEAALIIFLENNKDITRPKLIYILSN